MELALVMGKLVHLVAELGLKSFSPDKVMIQSYGKSPLPWTSSSQTVEIWCHSCQVYGDS